MNRYETKVVGGPLGAAVGDTWIKEWPLIPFNNQNESALRELVKKCNAANKNKNLWNRWGGNGGIVLAQATVTRLVETDLNNKSYVHSSSVTGTQNFKEDEQGLVGALQLNGDNGVIVSQLLPPPNVPTVYGQGMGTKDNTADSFSFYDTAGEPLGDAGPSGFESAAQVFSDSFTVKAPGSA